MTDKSDDNVVSFPRRPTKAPASSTVQFEVASNTPGTVPKYSIRHQMFQHTPLSPALACSREQRAQLWRIWDLCHQIQKSAMYAVHVPVLADDLERHLELLSKQIPTPQGDTDGPDQN